MDYHFYSIEDRMLVESSLAVLKDVFTNVKLTGWYAMSLTTMLSVV